MQVDGAPRYRERLGVDVFFGSPKFVSQHKIQIGEDVLEFHRAVIATGESGEFFALSQL